MIRKFFEQLAGYYSRENDLSNIAVALCNSSNEFRGLFLRFFFPEMDTAGVGSIVREVPDQNGMGSRVDIHISLANDPRPYIIEVKIEDRSHHFGQYEAAYGIGKERFGYITNYDCIEGKALGYDVKTWEEFYDYISASGTADELTQAFAAYLKNVCGITKHTKPMELRGLDSIPCFADTARKIIAKAREGVRTAFYREYVYSSSIHEGFTVDFPGHEGENGFALLGLWFQEKPIITVGVSSRRWLSEKIMSDGAAPVLRPEIARRPYQEHFWDKSDVWFEMSDEQLERFMAAETYGEQFALLDEFLTEVLSALRRYF